MSGKENKEGPVVYESELEEEFRVHEERYERIDADLGADLDDVAQRLAKEIKARGFIYPKHGSNFEKWKILRQAVQKSEAEKKLDQVREQVAGKLGKIEKALDDTDSDAYKRALEDDPKFTENGLEMMELSLDEILEVNPTLEQKIRELRELIGKLRRLV